MTGANSVTETATQAGLAEVAAQIARGLSKADLVQGRAFIRTSVMLPSGSTVVVVVEDQGGGRYRLSDIGQGFEEADRLGMGRTYRRQAEDVAALSGIAFAGNAFVLSDTTQRQLVGGTMSVANAVARTAERTLLRAAQRPQDSTVERLVARLGHLFRAAPRGVRHRHAEPDFRGLRLDQVSRHRLARQRADAGGRGASQGRLWRPALRGSAGCPRGGGRCTRPLIHTRGGATGGLSRGTRPTVVLYKSSGDPIIDNMTYENVVALIFCIWKR